MAGTSPARPCTWLPRAPSANSRRQSGCSRSNRTRSRKSRSSKGIGELACLASHNERIDARVTQGRGVGHLGVSLNAPTVYPECLAKSSRRCRGIANLTPIQESSVQRSGFGRPDAGMNWKAHQTEGIVVSRRGKAIVTIMPIEAEISAILLRGEQTYGYPRRSSVAADVK